MLALKGSAAEALRVDTCQSRSGQYLCDTRTAETNFTQWRSLTLQGKSQMMPVNINVAGLLVRSLFVLAAGNALPAMADIGSLPETDERVAVYRALEGQFKEKNWRDEDVPQAECETGYVFSPDGKLKDYTGKYCVVRIDRGCQDGMFPQYIENSDGYWAWTQSRIGHRLFLNELVRRYKLPAQIFNADFRAMDDLIIKNIERKLKRPAKMGAYKMDRGMSRADDARRNYATFTNMEERFAKKWNDYVLSHPGPRSATKTPLLNGVTEGCGAGEIEFEVASNPPGGKIHIISDTDAMLCVATNKDPWDTEACHGWMGVSTKSMGLVGIYRYTVSWSNGKKERDKFRIEPMDDAKKLCLPGPCPQPKAVSRR